MSQPKREVEVEVIVLVKHELGPNCNGKWWFPGETAYRNPRSPNEFGERSYLVARCNGSAGSDCPAEALIGDASLKSMLFALALIEREIV